MWAILTTVFLQISRREALAQDAPCTGGSVCVPPADLQDMVKALKEQRCLKTTTPILKLDPIIVTEDKDGRVFVTGAEPHPYSMTMSWCSYDVKATGKVNVDVARMVPATYGFRFRPKATLGFLIADTFSQDSWSKGVDGGILLEPFFWQWINLNAFVGVRSVGGGVGFDLTKNMGVFTGYAATWDGWRSNPYLSFYFAF